MLAAGTGAARGWYGAPAELGDSRRRDSLGHRDLLCLQPDHPLGDEPAPDRRGGPPGTHDLRDQARSSPPHPQAVGCLGFRQPGRRWVHAAAGQLRFAGRPGLARSEPARGAVVFGQPFGPADDADAEPDCQPAAVLAAAVLTPAIVTAAVLLAAGAVLAVPAPAVAGTDRIARLIPAGRAAAPAPGGVPARPDRAR